MTRIKHWKSLVALIVMPFAFYFDLVAFYFALLFLVWSIQGLRNGTIFLLDHIDRKVDPALYWVVTVVWLLLSLLSLLYSEPIIPYYYGY